MYTKKIMLNGFRNYEWETVDFSKETNVIYGPNAQGKTNLLEAVYMLSMGKSFRTRFDRELIGFDYNSAELLAEIESHDRNHDVRIVMQHGLRKKITVNAVVRKASELSQISNVVLFCPEDLSIIKQGASERRKLLDNAISQIRPNYAQYLTEFNRYYEQKLKILKDWRDMPSLLDMLDDFSDGVCRLSAKMIRYRASYAEKLNQKAKEIHSDFSKGEDLEIRYKTVSTVTNPFASEKEIYYEILQHQEQHQSAEKESGQCLTGCHKDDLEIFINGKPAGAFASQGQTRTAALSIKLAEREIDLMELGEYPILLLDDVLSELDEKRQEFVLNRIGGGQTLITCCEDEGISKKTGGKVIQIRDGRIYC